MAESSPPANPVRARWQLLGLMMMPMGVVLLATFVFYTGIGMPEGTRNKGALLTPAMQIGVLAMQDANGKPHAWTVDKDMWTLLVAHEAHCDAACRQQFWEIRQTRIALGKYQSHVRRVWLVTGGMLDTETQQWLAREHSDIALVYATESSWSDLINKASSGEQALTSARCYLLDPRGFIMMYYRDQDSYKDVITDIKFLLKGVE